MTNIKSDLMSAVTDSVINKMETCGASWLKSWVGNSSLPVNCENGKQYNGINLFILLGEEKTSGKWGTYKAWDRLGKQMTQLLNKIFTELCFMNLLIGLDTHQEKTD